MSTTDIAFPEQNGKRPSQRGNRKFSPTERNNLRFLQRKCRAAIEDIEDATRTYGAYSIESAEVAERYKQQLGRHFVQILNEAVRSLDQDLG